MKRLIFGIVFVLCWAVHALSQVPGMFQPLLVGQPEITLSYQGQTAYTTPGSSSHTFTGAAIGTAAADRYVIVAVSAAKDTSVWSPDPISSVTLAGNGMTLAGSQILDGSGASVVAIYYLLVPTGTTADIAVTVAAAAHPYTIDVWSMVGAASGTPTATASNTTTATSISASLAIPGGGIGIGIGGGNTNQAFTWTNMTLGTALADGNGSAASSYYIVAGTATRTMNASGSVPLGLALAAWR